MSIDISLDLTEPSNIIGTMVKTKDAEGNIIEDVVISFVKENNYIKLYVAGGEK